MLSNMRRSWVLNNSWPLKQYKVQIQAYVIGLPIKNIHELILLKLNNYPLKPSFTLEYQKFKEFYIVGCQKIWFCLKVITYKKVCYLYSPLSFGYSGTWWRWLKICLSNLIQWAPKPKYIPISTHIMEVEV
jgi:hypothetical protein